MAAQLRGESYRRRCLPSYGWTTTEHPFVALLGLVGGLRRLLGYYNGSSIRVVCCTSVRCAERRSGSKCHHEGGGEHRRTKRVVFGQTRTVAPVPKLLIAFLYCRPSYDMSLHRHKGGQRSHEQTVVSIVRALHFVEHFCSKKKCVSHVPVLLMLQDPWAKHVAHRNCATHRLPVCVWTINCRTGKEETSRTYDPYTPLSPGDVAVCMSYRRRNSVYKYSIMVSYCSQRTANVRTAKCPTKSTGSAPFLLYIRASCSYIFSKAWNGRVRAVNRFSLRENC